MEKKVLGFIIGMLMISVSALSAVGTPDDDNIFPKNAEIHSLGEILKWEQLPDTTENGTDIRCDQNDQYTRLLADDFNCTSKGKITNVTFWGSWNNDTKGKITMVHLNIYEDVPVNPPTVNYSRPGEKLWDREIDVVYGGNFWETLYATVEPGEWWWDPYDYHFPVAESDKKIWQYDITIDSAHAFKQVGTPENPVTYWLGISIYTTESDVEFGWKTSLDHWNDDATFRGSNDSKWYKLAYHYLHPYYMKSLDLAFRLQSEPSLTVKLPPFSFIPQMVNITGIIKNNGDGDFGADFPWKYEGKKVSGVFVKKGDSEGELAATIPPDEEIMVQSGSILGLGILEITLTVGDLDPVTKKALVIGPFIWMYP